MSVCQPYILPVLKIKNWVIKVSKQNQQNQPQTKQDVSVRNIGGKIMVKPQWKKLELSHPFLYHPLISRLPLLIFSIFYYFLMAYNIATALHILYDFVVYLGTSCGL
jgi:hypothetical protein